MIQLVTVVNQASFTSHALKKKTRVKESIQQIRFGVMSSSDFMAGIPPAKVKTVRSVVRDKTEYNLL